MALSAHTTPVQDVDTRVCGTHHAETRTGVREVGNWQLYFDLVDTPHSVASGILIDTKDGGCAATQVANLLHAVEPTAQVFLDYVQPFEDKAYVISCDGPLAAPGQYAMTRVIHRGRAAFRRGTPGAYLTCFAESSLPQVGDGTTGVCVSVSCVRNENTHEDMHI